MLARSCRPPRTGCSEPTLHRGLGLSKGATTAKQHGHSDDVLKQLGFAPEKYHGSEMIRASSETQAIDASWQVGCGPCGPEESCATEGATYTHPSNHSRFRLSGLRFVVSSCGPSHATPSKSWRSPLDPSPTSLSIPQPDPQCSRNPEHLLFAA